MTHPFTPTYIQMAKAAEEIQIMKLDCLGPYAEIEDSLRPEVSVGDGINWRFIPAGSPYWIPFLHQLMGMLDLQSDQFASHLHGMADDIRDGGDWHEVAIQEVMQGKYGKTWRDGKWVSV